MKNNNIIYQIEGLSGGVWSTDAVSSDSDDSANRFDSREEAEQVRRELAEAYRAEHDSLADSLAALRVVEIERHERYAINGLCVECSPAYADRWNRGELNSDQCDTLIIHIPWTSDRGMPETWSGTIREAITGGWLDEDFGVNATIEYLAQ